MTQNDTETVAQSVSRLRLNADGCEFADVNDQIKDQAEVQADDNRVTAEFIQEDGDSLLSRKTSLELKVLRIGLDVQNVSANENEDTVEEFKPLFTAFGRLKDRQIKLTVYPDVKPVAQPVRGTPFG